MNEMEIIEQIVEREITNAIMTINPSFKIFSGVLTTHTMNFIKPYIELFINPDTSRINIKAAGEYLKEETA